MTTFLAGATTAIAFKHLGVKKRRNDELVMRTSYETYET